MAQPRVLPVLRGDHGLLLEAPGQFYGLSALLETPLALTGDKPLILQYEVKHERAAGCGGAYLKLVSQPAQGAFRPQHFDADTPYSLLFGPDVCGDKDEVRPSARPARLPVRRSS